MRKLFLFLITIAFISMESLAQDEDLSEGIQLFENAEYSEAKVYFQSRFNINPNDDRIVYYLGRITYMEKDYDASVDFFKKAIELGNKSKYHSWLGNVYGTIAQDASVFRQVGYAKKIKNAFETAVELDSGNLDARYNLARYYIQAPGFMGGSMEKAHEQAVEIRKLDGVLGHIVYADIYKQEDDFELAEAEFQNGIKTFPESTILYLSLAQFYEEREDYGKCISTYEAILKVDSSRIDAYYSIGRLGAIRGVQLDKAAHYLKEYLKCQPAKNLPPHAWAHYRLGMVYENMGKKELARQEYQNALRLDPELEDAEDALEDL